MKSTFLKLVIILFITVIFSIATIAQNDSTCGLQTDIMIHPTNAFTAQTLKKNEIVINWAPQTLPIPTWAYFGITDKFTLMVDNNIILGLFVKPHLPVLSLNGRYKLLNQNKMLPDVAVETMVQYLYEEFDQAGNPYFATWRKDFNWFSRINMSWKIAQNLYVHTSGGFSFSQYLRLENKDTLNYHTSVFHNKISPDYMIGLDYRFKRISFHLNYSYGTTFNYIDNVARKTEFMYGFRLAPFYKNKFGFLRTIRLEWVGFYNEFKDIDANAYVPFFFPYLYWQWTIK